MPCQDTLLMMREGTDPQFAEALNRDNEASNARFKAELELCRVGSRLADGLPPDDVVIGEVPEELTAPFDDDWGERIRQGANADILAAGQANQYLLELRHGEVSAGAREWLTDHWNCDLGRLQRDNERHKREILLPRYSQGPKYEKRVARIKEDTPEIERLKKRLEWISGK